MEPPDPPNPHVLHMPDVRWEDSFKSSFKEAVPDDALRGEIADSMECAISRQPLERSEPLPTGPYRVYTTGATKIAPLVRIYFRIEAEADRITLVLADRETSSGAW
jgi:hypothetical protein